VASVISNICHQALLLRFRWGNFVPGTEHDQAAMDIVQKFIADAFTQSRSIIKKEVRAPSLLILCFTYFLPLQIVKSVEIPRPKKSNSDKKHVPSLRPKEERTTIYQLTKTIVQKLSGGKTISIPITAALCARVAMMVRLLYPFNDIQLLISSSASGMSRRLTAR
jgi:hypothetical protein